jgi:hypothetical protein
MNRRHYTAWISDLHGLTPYYVPLLSTYSIYIYLWFIMNIFAFKSSPLVGNCEVTRTYVHTFGGGGGST